MKLSDALATIDEKPNELLSAFEIDDANSGKPKDFMKIATFLATKSKQEKPTSFFGRDIPQPKIGAVLVVDGRAFCSARSGYKIGDHAEYTAINSMALKSVKDLSAAVLYTTLEPCTPESRKQWTECCCKLIVDSQISKVYVGSVDANPLVTGMGIKAMKDHDIDVQFFDAEFRKPIKDLNEEFFKFFEEITDSKTIKMVADAIWDDLDQDAINFYCQKASFSKEDPSFDHNKSAFFLAEMIKQGLITKGDGLSKVGVTDSFALAFFKKPSIRVHGYRIAFYDERDLKQKQDRGEVEPKRQDILGSAMIACSQSVPQLTPNNNIFLKILEKYGYRTSGRDVFSELDRLFPSKTAAREMIINTIVHNNYKVCPCVSVHLYSDHIEIVDAAALSPDDIQHLNEGKMPSVPQNPELMEIFDDVDLTEHHHNGMNEIKNNPEKIFNPRNPKKGDGTEDKEGDENKIFVPQTIKGQQFVCTRISVKAAH